MDTSHINIRAILIFASLSLVTACDNESKPDIDNEPTARAGGTLERATDESLTAYFRESLDANKRGSEFNDDSTSIDGVLEASTEGGASPAADTATFSGTTLQEAGVDEADLVKTDGEFIYSIYKNNNTHFPIASDPGFAPEKPTEFSQGIRIMQTGDSGLTEVKNIALNNTVGSLSGIYLTNQNEDLIAVASGGNTLAYDWFYSPYFSQQTTDIQWINVRSPADASVTNTLSIDGNLVSSRRVGNVLYLMLRHYPNVFPVEPNSPDGSTSPDLANKNAQDFLPQYQLNQASRKPAVSPEDCFINTGASRQSADIITLAAIKLDTDIPEFETTCFVGSSEALYASTKALYLASTRWDYSVSNNAASYAPEVTTDIHKFAFQGLEFNYRGSAEVGGHLGWLQDRKSYRMSESADGKHLRVVTHNEQRPWIAFPTEVIALDSDVADTPVAANADAELAAESSPVMLTILEENSQQATLDIVSQLPNRNSPASIGKPGEQLYASRFIGDRAYLVTFRITDPLYVLDLSNPLTPEVKGELEINGYSDFLFSVSENLLLGVGKDAIATEQEPSNFRGGAWYQGVKLSLINVEDPNNPEEVDTVIIGKRGTESPALQNPHAVTLLNTTDGTTRVALPITLNDKLTSSNFGPRTYYDYTHTGLYRYEINPVTEEIVALAPLVTHQRFDSEFAPNNYDSRSVIIDDNVHFLQSNQFWSQDWAGKFPPTGPK